jgi:predicted ThiF/HesA family dinucleotide-utilizing enzyme
MDDDVVVIDSAPGVRLGVTDELTRAALERSRRTGTPTVVTGFTSTGQARMVDVEAAEGDQQLVALPAGRVHVDVAGIRRRVERVLRLVPRLRSMPD